MLPGLATMTLIITAPEDSAFEADDQVKVSWAGKNKFIRPLPVDVGLFGLNSALPPTELG